MQYHEVWLKSVAWLKDLSPWQKAIGTASLIIVLLGGGVAAWRGRSDFAPLFAQLAPVDAAAVVGQLEQRGIAYRIAENGTTILVPRPDVHTIRLALAAEGLPQGGVVGLEALDKFQFGTTEFERRLGFLRAVQGELTRTISRLEGVENARVHLTMPEPSLFVSEKQAATAAVMLELRPGYTMATDQVRSIINLVAGSVENLPANEITIIDQRGRLLSGDLATDKNSTGAHRSLENIEVQNKLQSNLAAGVQKLLEPIFGSGNVVTQVWAELNFDETSIERQVFERPPDPEAMLRSVQDLREQFEGSGAAAGVPGVDGNVPTYVGVSSGGDSQYERTETIRNYELTEIRERHTVAPGSVARLSVSVVVNRPLTAPETEAIRTTVATSLGYDDQRNDQISVLGTTFDTTIADQINAALLADAEAQQAQRRLQVMALVGGGAILLVIGLWVLLARRRRAAKERLDLILDQHLDQHLGQHLDQEVAPTEIEELEPKVSTNGDLMRQRLVEQLAAERPSEVAQVLRTWLADES